MLFQQVEQGGVFHGRADGLEPRGAGPCGAVRAEVCSTAVGKQTGDGFLFQSDFRHLIVHHSGLEFGIGQVLKPGLSAVLKPEHHQEDGGTEPQERKLVRDCRLLVLVRLLLLVVWPTRCCHLGLRSPSMILATKTDFP